jgi:serine/threonine-protein phosphatase 5
MQDWLKNSKVLHKKYAVMIINRAKEIFDKDKSLVYINASEGKEITICGDVHGQYYDLLNIFSINGDPSEINWYLFNGDFVDRGSFSVEVIISLLAWKVCYPKYFFMNRGNHEAK